MSTPRLTNDVPPSRWSAHADGCSSVPSLAAVLGGEAVGTVAVGDVIRVPEGAYLPGVGELLLYVAEIIGRAQQADGHVWAEVSGHAVQRDGSLQVRRRYARVRVDQAVVVPRRAW
ncbi:hypothetical protein ABZ738_10665 [Micromonospora sp. NPDC047793]|uniref:hypothetical protein n=1 Tax=unclassified Micromonospora TaxID=2617518 RepID=UPI0033F75A99